MKTRARKGFCLCLALSALFSLAACRDSGKNSESSSSEIPDYPVEIGGTVLNEMPEKVISLSPALTEMIYALGSETKLAGVCGHCDYPEEAAGLPKVGTPALPDLDMLFEIAPDAVVTVYPLAEADAEKLKMQRIPVFTFSAPRNFDELADQYLRLAKIFAGNRSGPVNAEATFRRIRGKIDELAASYGEPKHTAIYVSALSPDGETFYVATAATFTDLLLKAAGADNAAADVSGFSMTAKELAAAAPDYLFCDESLVDKIKAHPVMAKLPEGAKNRVAGIPAAWIESRADRMADAVRRMAEVLKTGENAGLSDPTASQ